MERITDRQVTEAKGILRAAYYQDVKDRAEEIKERIDKGEIPDNEGLCDALHEECDGSQWAIYTSHSWHCLFSSDNDEAYFKEGLSDGGSELIRDGDALRVEVLAYWALHADLRETLETLGIPSDWDGAEEADEEEEEEEKEATEEERAAVARVLADGAWHTTEAVIEGTGLDAERAIAAIVALEAEGVVNPSFGRREWVQYSVPIILDDVCAAIQTGDGTTGDVERATNLIPSAVTKALRLLELQGRIQRTEETYRLAE